MKDGFGEVNRTSCRLLTLSKRGSWGVNKEVHLAQHSVVSLVLQVGDAQNIPQVPGRESLDPSLGISKPPPLPPSPPPKKKKGGKKKEKTSPTESVVLSCVPLPAAAAQQAIDLITVNIEAVEM